MEVPLKVSTALSAEPISPQTIGRDGLPVVRNVESLPHDALIRAVQPEGAIDVPRSGFWNQTKNVANLMHRLGDDAVVGVLRGQTTETVGRDDRTESVNSQSDAEVAVVIVQVTTCDHDVVVRLGFLPRLVVKQCQEFSTVELILAALLLGVGDVPVDRVPLGEVAVAIEPVGVPPHTEVVNLHVDGGASSDHDLREAVEYRLCFPLFHVFVEHDKDRSSAADCRCTDRLDGEFCHVLSSSSEKGLKFSVKSSMKY